MTKTELKQLDRLQSQIDTLVTTRNEIESKGIAKKGRSLNSPYIAQIDSTIVMLNAKIYRIGGICAFDYCLHKSALGKDTP